MYSWNVTHSKQENVLHRQTYLHHTGNTADKTKSPFKYNGMTENVVSYVAK